MRRELRLTGSKRISTVLGEGRSCVNRFLVLKALPNGLDRPRFAFLVGRRIGKAVVRNKVKRRLREIFRTAGVSPGWDVVVIARRPSAEADFHTLREASHRLLRRAGLLPSPSQEGVEK